jgi:hypothetical protein
LARPYFSLAEIAREYRVFKAAELWLRHAAAQPQRAQSALVQPKTAQLPASKKASKNNVRKWTECCSVDFLAIWCTC